MHLIRWSASTRIIAQRFFVVHAPCKVLWLRVLTPFVALALSFYGCRRFIGSCEYSHRGKTPESSAASIPTVSAQSPQRAAQQGAAPDRLQLRSFRSFLTSLSALSAAGELVRCAAASFCCVSAQLALQVLASRVSCSLARVAWPRRRSACWFRSAQQSAAPDRKKRHSIRLLTASFPRRFLRQVSLALCRCFFVCMACAIGAASTCAVRFVFSYPCSLVASSFRRLASFGTTRRST